MLSIPPEWQTQSLPELSQTLAALHSTMLSLQQQTQYSSAQHYRTQYQTCKQYIVHRQLSAADTLHHNNVSEMTKARDKEILGCGRYWDGKVKEYNEECQRLGKDMERKNGQQAAALRLELEEQLSMVVKESNQLINLRNMEAHAAKQKNFVEAHSIQQKVKAIYQKQRNQWLQNRQKTIQQNLKNLRAKQSAQLQNLNHRIKLALEDFAKQRFMDQTSINQKYDNNLKQQKARYEREILSIQGQLKNSGGGSPKRTNKIKVRE